MRCVLEGRRIGRASHWGVRTVLPAPTLARGAPTAGGEVATVVAVVDIEAAFQRSSSIRQDWVAYDRVLATVV